MCVTLLKYEYGCKEKSVTLILMNLDAYILPWRKAKHVFEDLSSTIPILLTSIEIVFSKPTSKWLVDPQKHAASISLLSKYILS